MTHPLVERAACGQLPPWAVLGDKRRRHVERVAGLLEDWAVAGSADDCIQGFQGLAEAGADFVGATFYNLPKTLEARKEYLQHFAESVIHRMK